MTKREYAVSYPAYFEDGAPRDITKCADYDQAVGLLGYFNRRAQQYGWVPPAGEEPRIKYRDIPDWQDYDA